MEMTTAEKLAKVMELSVKINQETDFCTIVRFSGHAGSFNLDIASSKEDYNDTIAQAEIANYNWNKNYESQLDQLIENLQFIVHYHAIPEDIPVFDWHNSFNKHGLCKTKLSQGCNLNESTLVNTSTESYLSIRESVKEA